MIIRLYLAGPRRNTIVVNHRCPVDGLSDEHIARLATQTFTPDEFQVYSDSFVAHGSPMTEWQEVSLHEDVKNANDFSTPGPKTPHGRFNQTVLEVHMPSLALVPPVDGTQSIDPQDRLVVLEQMLAAWPVILANFDSIEEALQSLPVGISAEINPLMESIQEATTGLDIKCRLLQSKLGWWDETLFPDHPNVWGALSMLQSDLQSVRAAQERGNPRELDDRLGRVSGRLSTLREFCSEQQTYVNKEFERLETLIRTPTRSTRFGDDVDVRDMVQIAVDRAAGGVKRKLDHLEERLDGLEAHDMEVDADPGAGEGASPRDILDRLTVLEGNTITGSCKVGERAFVAEHDVLTFVREQEITGDTGVFWDLASLLICMNMQTTGTGKERADSIHSAQRAGRISALESNFLAGLSHPRPTTLFGKDTIAAAARDSLLVVATSYEEWIQNGSYSVRTKFEKRLSAFVGSVKVAIRGQRISSLAKDVAIQMVEESHNHWVKLSQFLDSMYLELTSVAQFRPASAWALMGKCLSGMFDYTDSFRSPVSLVESTNTLMERAAVSWAVLQSHQAMHDLVAAGFKTHPVVVKEISLFMLTERVDPIQMDSLRTDLVKAKKDAADSKKVADAADERVKVLESAFKTLSNEHKQLKDKVAKLK